MTTKEDNGSTEGQKPWGCLILIVLTLVGGVIAYSYDQKELERRRAARALYATPSSSKQASSTPFTNESNGFDWRAAPYAYRMTYCNEMASIGQKHKPGVTGQFIFESLQEVYISDDHLKEKIVGAVALTILMAPDR